MGGDDRGAREGRKRGGQGEIRRPKRRMGGMWGEREKGVDPIVLELSPLSRGAGRGVDKNGVASGGGGEGRRAVKKGASLFQNPEGVP